MNAAVALCVDNLSRKNPSLIGLEGESLESQPWLRVFADGEGARAGLQSCRELSEAWVVSCDDVEPINLAAALKADRSDLVVRLVDFEGGGSLLSRAHTANIDEVMGRATFVSRYAAAKQSASGAAVALSERPPAPADEWPSFQAAPLEIARPAAASILAARPHGFIMPVVGGSGGCGKSTISALSALIASEMGFKTLLLDYDLQFGDVAAMLGVQSPITMDIALSSPDLLFDASASEAALTVVGPPPRIEIAESIEHMVPQLLEAMGDSFEIVVANTGAGWAEQHAALLERSTVALFLVDQRSSSVRACKHALELCSRCGIATGQFQFVLNRCAKGAPLSSADVSNALQGVDVFELKDGGRDVEDFLAAGAAADLIGTGNELCTSLRRLLASILPSTGANTTAQANAAKGKAPAKRRGRHEGRRRGWAR